MDTASVKDKKRIMLEIPLLNCTVLNTTFAVTTTIIMTSPKLHRRGARLKKCYKVARKVSHQNSG